MILLLGNIQVLDVRNYKYLYNETSNSFKKLLRFTVFYESLKCLLANSLSSHCNNICLCSSTTERCLSQLDDFTTNTDQFTS